ncbi:MAG: glutamate-5-semialdehyde dehydrogenase [Succiniclasticum sp.]|jgi:glutamate-5-semialdehyde dehydrogenase|nr:glutamate-5-semialdehyde dehydrogenase [Succiniclasticum sp.]MEE3479877.1 glutamate-5-semialdehyde dehydrogenase [Succiniclasticum sp.]
MSIKEQAQAAVLAERRLATLSTAAKNAALLAMADALLDHAETILAENAKDIEAGKAKHMKESMLDRLLLTQDRLAGMAEGLRQVAALPDPVGTILGGSTLPNGLTVTKIRVPLGVIGIVYEARPNVTADAIGLCLKSGNAVILKGGSEAIRSNTEIARVLREAAEQAGVPAGSVQFITSTDHAAVTELVRLNGLVDVVIPRGSARLINAVMANATVPVIQTGVGVCHTFVDASADFDMAERIIVNAKTQRPSTCNAMETLLVHRAAADTFLPRIVKTLQEHGVTVIGDETVQAVNDKVQPATDADWATEYNDLRLSVKVVDSLDEALEHIARYSTKHSECIVTEDYANARRFQQAVDAACVYVNASTRFTDGFQFGFGAEIGISTQKLHARGPMALPELTTYKYLISGDGQVRP